MSDTVILEWAFSPPDYFEEVVRIERDGYTMIIDNGRAEARIDPAAYDSEHKMRGVLHGRLNDRFLAVQVVTHKPYELSKSTMCLLHADGRKDVTLFPETGVFKISSGNVDFVVTDKNGEVISDSRRDRIAKKAELAELAERYGGRDELAASLLASYQAAVRDSRNELVHLYEIREALSRYFGGESATCSALRISHSDWSRLGRLANEAPVIQGRHRGKHVGGLRSASAEELEQARRIAQCLIGAYMSYLADRGPIDSE